MKSAKLILLACISLLSLPTWAGRNIVLNVPQRVVYLYENGKLFKKWTVAVGNPASPTPLGSWKISEIRHDPTWYVPASIQKEIRDQGGEIGASVGPGEKNPLGAFFLRLGNTSIGIHGTNVPRSLGTWNSHGCVRMHDEDVAELAGRIKVGDPVSVIYDRFNFTRTRTALILALQADGYQRQAIQRPEVEARIRRDFPDVPLTEIAWQEVNRMIAQPDGLPTAIWRAPLAAGDLD